MKTQGAGLALVLGLGAMTMGLTQGRVEQIGEQAGGAALVSSNQRITPVGKLQTLRASRPKDVAVSPDGALVAVLAQNQVALYSATGESVASVAGIEAGPLGIVWEPSGQALYATLAGGKVARFAKSESGWKKDKELTIDSVGALGDPDIAAGTQGRGRQTGDPQLTGLAISPDGARLYVGMGIRNVIAVVNLTTGKTERTVLVDAAPYHLRLSPDGKTLAVSCRGGRVAGKNEASADSAGTAIRIDTKTDAAKSGSVALVDTASLTARKVEAGRQPSGLAFTKDSKTLYVASSDDDTLQVLDVVGAKVTRAFVLAPEQDPGFGQIPTAVALSSNERVAYVACGGANAIAHVELATGKILGYTPTGWYPIALSGSPMHGGGGGLVVASSKGYGSRTLREKPSPASGVHGTLGLVQFTPPTIADPKVVAENNRWGMAERPARRGVAPVPVPERVGEPSVFKHVVYIIKENQTYDYVFGDMKEGNGDPKLALFPEEVTPNHHALARQFVLLDNTYTSGTNSADGHQWSVSAVANDYMEHNYAAHTRSYPYDGGDALSGSPTGFLWTAAVAKKKSVRVYGEFVNKPVITDTQTGKPVRPGWKTLWDDYKSGGKRYAMKPGTDNAALRPLLHPTYIGFPSTVSDQWRADQYLADIDQFEKDGKMPNLSILLLPDDHTAGTRAGGPTPRATVADNDLALGRIVERLSKSKFWKETLILVIEDDSQFGVDHVDGHRTVALCISPYTRRGSVNSTLFNHTSFIRTIGLTLGFPAMNRFDRTATPLTSCFTSTPDLTPFAALPNRIPLDELNPGKVALSGEARRLAEACEKLNWDDVDKADAETVARAIWSAQRPGIPFPRALYQAPTGSDGDGDE
ncbi:bifunctional YncE family protein/alkaline phosphatase family protein [Armatimonas rosea]|uniref:DNA-binding beta-propeller fold protein YncE n=1 Tax=Armatimonas rosea TaxID=685828 RepID=A0A7W9W4R6_ARMRO|nr:bifunctional YncE family protein/alkaline phosphatase family protein [Armatimonas rosea]MBB6049684.1 DNA-binding beta-propeller fold protein YncE [Armatimonas rosea]